MRNITTRLQPGRWTVAAALLLLLLGGGLALDLANQGLVWDLFWRTTGEEEPLAQVRGFIEYLGNFIRPAPRTEPYIPIQHTDVTPYGVNTFLQQEVEVSKRERQLQMIAEAGFGMIRQQFPWEDIEIDGRGDFIDRRNDLNGDGTPDEIDAWAKYDNIINLAEQYGIEIQARLDGPPKWSNAKAGGFGPPDDYQDFVNYTVAVAERYKGRIRYYQVWNEPNANGEWGDNQPVSAVQYTDLLCRTYAALKTVDPAIVIISGPLSPTVSMTERNLSDLIFLQQMYDAGAGACFDVMSAQGYGFYSGPTDRRMRPTTLTFARHIYIRDIMVANGDAHKSIWISEAAWNPVPPPEVVPDIVGRLNFGQVTEEQAARYMPLAYERARQEWPWLGNIAYWFFKRAADYERNQSFYYFRMVEPDFTPLPVYESMKQYITTQQPVLYPGVYQAEHWAVKSEAAPIIENLPRQLPLEDAAFGSATELTQATFTTHGTDVILRVRLSEESAPTELYYGLYGVMENDAPVIEPVPIPEDNFVNVALFQSQSVETHTFRLFIAGEGLIAQPFIIDSITVLDRSAQNLTPLVAGAVIALGMLLVVFVRALRERRTS